MSKKPGLLSAPLFSPHGFLLIALALGIVFAAAHLAGLRHYTSVISLTYDEHVSMQQAGMYAGLYLFTYMGVTLLCPVFVLAAAILALLQRFTRSGTGSRAID